MKTIYLRTVSLIILIIFLVHCDGQRTIKLSDIQIKNGIYYMIGEDKPFTGSLIDFYSNEKKKIEEDYKDGKIEGRSIHWFENGQIKFELILNNGFGKKTGWYETGQKKYELSFNNWKSNGKYVEWYISGEKKFEVHYKDGKAVGKFTEWEKNGFIKSEGNM